ncbi:MAG: NifB/NifX family molybdenum-iron cluster-binding protein [Planctomycetota bacterium]|jgi:predicted Fe-Mo cluster-binding NifX family protein
MKIAVPVTRNMRCAPFGSCDEFALFEIDGMRIAEQTTLPPPLESDRYTWLRNRGVNLIISAGMASASRDRLGQLGMRVVCDVRPAEALDLARDYLLGQLDSRQSPRN